MKYLIRNPLSLALIRTIDRLLSLFPSAKVPFLPPKKILLSNLANLGDVVIATAALPILKKAFPQAKIGFLIASWARPVLEKHPLVDALHFFDHAYINPKKLSRCKAVLHHIKTRRKALEELRASHYDLAIDLYPFFPNAIPLLKQAQIPFRLGYESGGFSPLLTRSIPWESGEEYMGKAHLRLLASLDLDTSNASPLPFLPTPPLSSKRGILLHIGSSSPLKDWPIEHWKDLIMKLSPFDLPLLLTGKGERERKLIEKMASLHPRCINLCNRLSWDEFVATLHNAYLVVSSDSVAIHIAAARQIPTIVLFSGMSPLKMWTPPYPTCKGLSHPVPCAPCHQKKGCPSMACIRNLSVEEVIATAKKLLRSAAPPPPRWQSSPSLQGRGH